MSEKIVKGYKVFNSDWTCRGKQYSCPGKFEEDVTPSACNQGMHFCKKAADCFNYYKFNPENKVAEVAAYGTVVEYGDKCCTDKLEIIREILWQELLEIVNIGKGCTGLCNSGHYNSGDCNSGDWNSGLCNSGCFNTFEQKIYLFNKPSNWTYQDWLDSDAKRILSCIPHNIEYIYFDEMTETEKKEHPEAEITDGYLKKNSKKNVMEWWKSLSEGAKNIVMSIPNFDKEIFKTITGIDVDEK